MKIISKKTLKQIDRSMKNLKAGKVGKPVDVKAAMNTNSLTFAEFSNKNRMRCEQSFRPLNSWSSTDWACALAGEVGELCNFIKKMRRGENIPKEDVGKEIADVVHYADLLAQSLGFSLEDLVVAKFNEVSERVKSLIKL